MQFFNFTHQEIKALLFLLMALLIGSGITIYKKYHPSFAPELILEKPSPVPFENQSQSSENPMVPQAHHNKDTESYSQEVLPEISKDSKASSISFRQKGNPISSIHENPLLKTPPFGPSPQGRRPKAEKKKIDLNSASASQLELLPQIGPVLSQRIIHYRETKGQFQKIEDLLKVPGIGPKTFDKIKDLITVR
jgi:competence ComEA-like helix-hairpin-helix protein